MANIVTFGLKNVSYSLITIVNGSVSYGPVKKIKGSQELSVDIVGGQSGVYADDIMIGSFNAIAGLKVSLKVTEVMDQFLIDVLGYIRDANGNLVENANAEIKRFALGYEMQGDDKKRRVWYLCCTAATPSDSTKTKTDTVEANTKTIEITCYSVAKGKFDCLKIVSTQGNSNYWSFLNNPPTFDMPQSNKYIWNPSNGKNDNVTPDDLYTYGTSIGHTYNGMSITRGTKINTSTVININGRESKEDIILRVVGYSNNATFRTGVYLRNMKTNRLYSPKTLFNLMNDVELTAIEFKLESGCDYTISMYNGESVLMYMEIEVELGL